MKNEDLLQAIGYVDEELLVEAEIVRKKKTNWRRWSVAAAIFAVAIGAGIYLIPQQQMPDLPKISLSHEYSDAGGGGLLRYEVAELENGNPWTKGTKLETLPVYQNLAYSDSAGMPLYRGENAEELVDIAKQTAAKLGMECGAIEYHKDYDENIYEVELKTNQGVITVDGSYQVCIFYDEENRMSLPDAYDTAINDKKQAEALTNYLVTEFADIINFKSAKSVLEYNYDISGNINISYMAYDANGSIEEQILNYHFSPATFYFDENNKLSIIRINQMLTATEKLGDYPLITEAKARKQLIKGDYAFTNGWEETPDKKNIVKVELAYLPSNLEPIFMPYYCYWVEVPEDELENGLKNYQAYFVPAVASQYLEQ